MRTATTLSFIAMICLALGACGSSDDDTAEDPTTTVAQADTPSSDETDANASGDATAEDAAGDGEALQELPPPALETLATEPTPPGPRPLLAWEGVDGAMTYDLIVLDASGTPYWAWSGPETSVHLGGVENPDAVGAWVFEPLTWIVTARDQDGQPIAMSDAAELLP